MGALSQFGRDAEAAVWRSPLAVRGGGARARVPCSRSQQARHPALYLPRWLRRGIPCGGGSQAACFHSAGNRCASPVKKYH